MQCRERNKEPLGLVVSLLQRSPSFFAMLFTAVAVGQYSFLRYQLQIRFVDAWNLQGYPSTAKFTAKETQTASSSSPSRNWSNRSRCLGFAILTLDRDAGLNPNSVRNARI